jgi:hypothetical protein
MIAMTSAPHSVADGQSYRTYVIYRNIVDLIFFPFFDKKSKGHSSKCAPTYNVGLRQLSFAEHFSEVERVR